MIAYRGRCIEQNGQKILFHVANFRGVLLQTVHDKLNVRIIQLQEPGTNDFMRKIASCNTGGLSLCTDRFHDQLHNFVQILPISFILLTQVLIPDILLNQFPITLYLCE